MSDLDEPRPAPDSSAPPSPDDLRERATRRLRKRADFRTHLMIYLAVNTSIVVIWVMVGSAFFWPIFPILGWGIGLGANAWDAYGPDPLSEDRIRREMNRLGG